MRNPARIPPFLAALQAVWETYPDYRFGQLVANLSGPVDPWHWEDGVWLDRMDTYLQSKAATNDGEDATPDGERGA